MTDNAAQKTPAKIRKIFLKDGIYICGLCATNYTDKASAEACLERCTPAHLNGEAVQEAAPKKYRCKYCKRIYTDMEKAKDCSRQCRVSIEKRVGEEKKAQHSVGNREAKMQALMKFAGASNPEALKAVKQVQQELKANGNVFKAKKAPGLLPGENVKFMRDRDQFRCLRCKQRYHASKEAISCYDMHAEGYKPKEKVEKREDTHKYFRDNAKYGCQKCRSLFFSADEAAKCWDEHPADYVRPKPSQDAPEVDTSTDEAPAKKAKEKTGPSDSDIYYRDGAKYVCKGCDKKFFTRDEVVACFHGHSVDENTLAELGAVEEGPSDAEMFFREGAKYVCKNCRSKYFTRDEVTTCFKGHS